MKHLCCSKYIFLIFFLSASLFASLNDKSAVVYYGKNISYPMVGIHDYIIVNPQNTSTDTHGFKLYKEKIYAKVLINNQISKIKEDIEKLLQSGYQNFFFDIEDIDNKADVISFINNFASANASNKLIAKAKIEILEKIDKSLHAIVLERFKDKDLPSLQAFGLDIIDIEYQNLHYKDEVQKTIEKISSKGMIPFITNESFDIYGQTRKKPIKREILTLINESKNDRSVLSAHQHGAMVFEYLGYIQRLHEVNSGLPDINTMDQYAGVVIWLSVDYPNPQKLIRWVLELDKIGIKVAFVNSFGANVDSVLLKELNIDAYDSTASIEERKTIIQRDAMIGFEIEPSLSDESLFIRPKNAKALLTYEDTNKLKSVPSAITSWGGYALLESFMLELNDENIWIINPFEFFQEALRLPRLLVPDTTTHNGNRLLFSHIDGDGIMNYVESNPELFSGDMILQRVLKTYKIPHSVSIIGAEVSAAGLYPEIATELNQLARKIYALDNVEGATHTFTHPFIWSKIKDGDLDEEYRLKVKGYKFSLDNEIKGELAYINANLQSKNKKKANAVFWSGDCIPQENALKYVYENNILNINGGYTIITNTNPYLTNVSPLGLQRGEYYQIYTGAQNENVYTNDWIGPFWGFKKVVQTFELTESPRRLKPINIYYHFYSGSKIASLNALKYIFTWALKQDVMPIFTSEYIPKVMDYYTVSMAQEGDEWLVEGMRDLKTLRIEKENAGIDLKNSKSSLGLKHFENHTYISLDTNTQHRIKVSNNEEYKKETYLISSNAKLVDYKNGVSNKQYIFDGHVDLKLSFNLPKECKLNSTPKASEIIQNNNILDLNYINHKKVVINVSCR